MTTPPVIFHGEMPEAGTHPYPPAGPDGEMQVSFSVRDPQPPALSRGPCERCGETVLEVGTPIPVYEYKRTPYYRCAPSGEVACQRRAAARRRAEQDRARHAGWAQATVALSEALAALKAPPAPARPLRPSQARRRHLAAAQARVRPAPQNPSTEPVSNPPVPGSVGEQEPPPKDAA